MRLAVTGPNGFLAWHVRCAWRARTGTDAVLIDREHFEDPSAMSLVLQGVDAVIHLAAINRGVPDDEIKATNALLAEALVRGVVDSGGTAFVVHANSIHSEGSSAFGESKRGAYEILSLLNEKGVGVADVVLPNVFGEHGRPNYNSFVATFCAQLAHGTEDPSVIEDRRVPLLHAQEVAALLIDAAVARKSEALRPSAHEHLVSDVLARLREVAQLYQTGQLPDLSEPFDRDLLNTYRSHAFPSNMPMFPDAMTDQRGRLVEAVRARGGQAQVFFSSTKPGMTRGQHFHLRKVERFLVMSGSARIHLRRMFTDDVITFEVNGSRPAIVDMPTMWAHSIENPGESDVVTLFYADQVFNPLDPDTFPEAVIR